MYTYEIDPFVLYIYILAKAILLALTDLLFIVVCRSRRCKSTGRSVRKRPAVTGPGQAKNSRTGSQRDPTVRHIQTAQSVTRMRFENLIQVNKYSHTWYERECDIEMNKWKITRLTFIRHHWHSTVIIQKNWFFFLKHLKSVF